MTSLTQKDAHVVISNKILCVFHRIIRICRLHQRGVEMLQADDWLSTNLLMKGGLMVREVKGYKTSLTQ